MCVGRGGGGSNSELLDVSWKCWSNEEKCGTYINLLSCKGCP